MAEYINMVHHLHTLLACTDWDTKRCTVPEKWWKPYKGGFKANRFRPTIKCPCQNCRKRRAPDVVVDDQALKKAKNE